MLKPLDQMLIALFGSFLPLYVGIPTKPYKRHATELLLYKYTPHATTLQMPTIVDSNPTASYKITFYIELYIVKSKGFLWELTLFTYSTKQNKLFLDL